MQPALTCHPVNSPIVGLLWPHDSAHMRQAIQTHPVCILVLPLGLHLQGLYTREALLSGDILGVLLAKHPFRELPGYPLLPGTELLRLEYGVLA